MFNFIWYFTEYLCYVAIIISVALDILDRFLGKENDNGTLNKALNILGSAVNEFKGNKTYRRKNTRKE